MRKQGRQRGSGEVRKEEVGQWENIEVHFTLLFTETTVNTAVTQARLHSAKYFSLFNFIFPVFFHCTILIMSQTFILDLQKKI